MNNDMNENYIPDNAFGDQQSTPAEAFQVEDKPASVFDQVAYEQMTQEQKFQAHKEAVYKKHGVDTSVKGPTHAEQVAAAESQKFTLHQDGSMTVHKGVLGNDKDSMAMIEILREQAYARHNITD
jgi:hypothetical protein